MPLHLLHHLTHSDRNRVADIQLGVLLAFVAGAINAGGFIAIGYYTSHMTGIVSSIGDYLALHQPLAAAIALGYLLLFIAGSAVSAIAINWAHARNLRNAYAPPLLLEALLLLMFGIISADIMIRGSGFIHLTIALLCFIMGLQNAIITKASRAEIRTTHITGIATDIGIESGRYLYRHCGGSDSTVFHRKKLLLNIGLLMAFLLGGLLGAVLFKELGAIATLPFAAILGLVASAPAVGKKRNR